MAKYEQGTSDTEILALREDLKGAAKAIRHCTCDQGYIVGPFSRSGLPGRIYRGAATCECMQEFKRIGQILNDAVRDWERANGREYPNLITPDMIDHAHPTGRKPSAEMIARARQGVYSAEVSFEIPEEVT